MDEMPRARCGEEGRSLHALWVCSPHTWAQISTLLLTASQSICKVDIITPLIVGGLPDTVPVSDTHRCPVNTAGFLPAARSLISPFVPRSSILLLDYWRFSQNLPQSPYVHLPLFQNSRALATLKARPQVAGIQPPHRGNF